MQPLRNGEQAAVCTRGTQVLQLLNTHASEFPQKVQPAGSAEEECEREVEQEQEAEQDQEQEVEHEVAVARLETDWPSWQGALECKSMEKFVVASGSQVCCPPACA